MVEKKLMELITIKNYRIASIFNRNKHQIIEYI